MYYLSCIATVGGVCIKSQYKEKTAYPLQSTFEWSTTRLGHQDKIMWKTALKLITTEQFNLHNYLSRCTMKIHFTQETDLKKNTGKLHVKESDTWMEYDNKTTY